jgi:translation initiation factor IF-3
VIGTDGQQLGVLALGDAIQMARQQGVDLVEIAPNAAPPVCRLVDYGKFRYEQSKKGKDARKHQHANKVKEVQLSPSIDPHDFSVKLDHAIEFLCDDMKVKVTLRFRGREMAHKEYGFKTVEKFINDLGPYGHPDAPPRLLGKGLSVMLSPLPRNKRAKNPHASAAEGPPPTGPEANNKPPAPPVSSGSPPARPAPASAAKPEQSQFGHNPFANLDLDKKAQATDEENGEAGQ